MAGVKISELNLENTLNDDDTLVFARPGLGNGSTYKIEGRIFGKASDIVALQNRATSLENRATNVETRATNLETRATNLEAGKVSKAGDTMTGKLTLDGNPTANLHAATKQYVDSQVSSAVGSIGKTWADFQCTP